MQSPIGQLKQQGVRAFEQKQYAEALELFRSILADHPGFADIRHYAGLCLVFLGRVEEALAELDLALEQNPEYVEAHINRALMLQDVGRYEEARASFEEAGRYEQQTHGRFPAAVTAKVAHAHAAVGDLYLDAQAWQEAAQQYRSALELRPLFHDIRNKYARALLELDRGDEAITELQRILDHNPRFMAARLNLGLAFYRQDRRSEAAEEWHTCQSQQPDHPQARAYLAMLESADAGRIHG
jgi:tetratricopeptide (TPR) repeat protein